MTLSHLDLPPLRGAAGSVRLPAALVPYMGGLEILEAPL